MEHPHAERGIATSGCNVIGRVRSASSAHRSRIGRSAPISSPAWSAGRTRRRRASTVLAMIRLLVRTLIFFASSAVGLIVADLLLDDMSVSASGFLITLAIFAVLQTVIAPFIARVTARNASALLGGAGLISTFIALAVAAVVGDSLQISGVSTWLIATVIVWLATALATLLIPLVLVKLGVRAARTNASQS